MPGRYTQAAWVVKRTILRPSGKWTGAAIRKAGEIFDQLEKTPPQKAASKSAAVGAGDSDYRQALDNSGIKERTAQDWQSFARTVREDKPEDYFESVRKMDSPHEWTAIS